MDKDAKNPNTEMWQKLAVLVLSIPLAAYLITQAGSDSRYGLLFTVIPILLVVSFLVMFIVHVARNYDK